MIIKKLNIFSKKIFKDRRGIIADIFYNTKINHVALIETKKNMVRGNHFHKKTTQYTYVVSGKIKYSSKRNNRLKKTTLTKGDVVKSSINEIHAYKGLSPISVMIIFSYGLRGGKDYEKDTFRVSPILK
tara:strand:- start:277 stop:663 length:387 start_codon:yes stop_codon:yes gene_type:complete